MKLAHLSCTFPPYKGGIGHSALIFAGLCEELGYDNTVITPGYANVPARGQEDEYPFAVQRLKPIMAGGNGAFLGDLWERLNQFDIVLLHYPFFGVAEPVWAHKFFKRSYRLVVHYHMDVSGLNWKFQALSLLSRLTQNSLLAGADMVTCASLDYVSASSIGGFYRRNPDKFREIGFGVDLELFKPDSRPKTNGSDILFVGGLDKAHYFKGLEVLFEALRGIDLPYRLQIVGEGDMKAHYAKMSKELGISGQVRFHGSLSEYELAKLYRESDLFVLPSINSNEAFGLVLLEAMASGVPVIASDLPGVRKVFEPGIQGLLTKTGDPVALRQNIQSLLSNPDLLQKMSRNARLLAEEHYSWSRPKAKLAQVFNLISNEDNHT